MKKSSKNIAKGFLVLTLLIAFSISVYAASTGVSLTVFFNDIKLEVNGKTIALGKDSAGKQIEPFIYNGTTYLPVRAVAEALNQPVNWNAEEKTVEIGRKPDVAYDMTELVEPVAPISYVFDAKNDKEFKIFGNTYSRGYAQYTLVSSGSMIFNLNGIYEEFSFDTGIMNADSQYESGVVRIILDGEEHTRVDVTVETLKSLTIPVKNVNSLKIIVENTSARGIDIAIANPTLK